MSKNIYFIIAGLLIGFYFFQTYTPSLSEKELAANKLVAMDYLMTNQSVEGVKATKSGLQYKVLEAGKGAVYPKVTDRVTVHYEGSLIDGTVFDSSVARGKPITFGLEKVIAKNALSGKQVQCSPFEKENLRHLEFCVRLSVSQDA